MSGRVAITGANGAVGRALCLAARQQRTPVVACVRSPEALRALPALGSDSQSARIDFEDEAALARAFAGASALVHLPGILVERKGASYEAAHVDTTRVALAAARRASVGKVVLVSALHADATARNRYHRTKGEAEELVRRSGLAYTILRAPLVLGPGTEGSKALRRRIGARRVLLPGGGLQLQQPLDVRDLARGVLRATEPGVAEGATLAFVGPESLPGRELVERAAAQAGRTVTVRSVPLALLRGALWLREWAGPGFSREALEVILLPERADPEPAARALGLELTPLDRTLAESLAEAPA